MTKKSTNIGKIIAGLAIILLGALLVYSLTLSPSTNSPDKNQEIPQKSIPQKKKKASENNYPQPPLQKGKKAPISKSPELNAGWEGWNERFCNGELTLYLVSNGILLWYIYRAFQVTIRKIKPEAIKNNFNKKWTRIIVCLGFLGMLSEAWLKSHAKIRAYVDISAYRITGPVMIVAAIMRVVVFVVTKLLENPIKKATPSNFDWEGWKKNLYDGELTCYLVCSGVFFWYVCQAVQVKKGKLKAKEIKNNFNKKWIRTILCLGCLGILSELWLGLYAEVRAYVFAIAFGITALSAFITVIVLVVLAVTKPLEESISDAAKSNAD